MLHLLRVEFSSLLKTLCSTDVTRKHRNPFLLHCHSWLCHWRSPVNLDRVEMYPPDYTQRRWYCCARLARQERAVWVWGARPCPEAAPISQSKCSEKTWCAWVAVSIQKHLCVFLTFTSSCCYQLYSGITVINWGYLKKKLACCCVKPNPQDGFLKHPCYLVLISPFSHCFLLLEIELAAKAF